MVAAGIDNHVILDRHMAVHTICTRRIGRVKMMLFGSVLFRTMALQADTIAWHPQFKAVRLMTIRARHPGMYHLAL